MPVVFKDSVITVLSSTRTVSVDIDAQDTVKNIWI